MAKKKGLKRHGKKINTSMAVISDEELDCFLNMPSRRGSSRSQREVLSDVKSQLRGAKVAQMRFFCPKHNF